MANSGKRRRVLVIGYGNPLRCDDGLGWQVVRQLEAQGLPEGVVVRRVIQLTPELAAEMGERDLVLFVDASQEGEPGEVRTRQVEREPRNESFTHEDSPAGLLWLAQRLHGVAPIGWLLTVAGERFEWGESLSPAVRASLPRVLESVGRLISGEESAG